MGQAHSGFPLAMVINHRGVMVSTARTRPELGPELRKDSTTNPYQTQPKSHSPQAQARSGPMIGLQINAEPSPTYNPGPAQDFRAASGGPGGPCPDVELASDTLISKKKTTRHTSLKLGRRRRGHGVAD
jgi:hypothetical protein